ncbi:50S ribosomal protein L1 [Candidatus Peregrinibacteria bacterium]|nr:50S ribosomal protein L1 [Candidatus Peregrinibacteria bacterium]
MSNHGKKYREVREKIDPEKAYLLDEALELLKESSTTNFDASCEVHFNFNLDPKQADQNLRTTVSLPAGTGKEVKVVAFVDAGDSAAAKAAGAIEAGTEELIAKIEKGWLDFDVAVAVPDQMKKLGKIAKTLGQKRLMPNPKAGTITPDFENAIKDLKKGKIEIRLDKDANSHNIFGKISFDTEKLKENLLAIAHAVLENKPTGIKGIYINNVSVSSSMGPGIKVDVADLTAAAK